MRYRIMAALALIGGFAVWQHFAVRSAPDDPGVDPFTSASISASPLAEFTLANPQSGTVCIAERGGSLTSQSRSFSAGKDCDSVWPGLSAVRNWTENGDGSVVLSNASGEQVLTVSIGDGVDYEALEPPNAVLTLTAIG